MSRLDHSSEVPAGSSAAEIAPQSRSSRLIWLDVARGVALVAMAIYHFAWDLEFFGYSEAGTAAQGGWRLFARSIASSFLFLAGFSLVLGHGRQFRSVPFFRRLAMIVAAAAAITIATYIATPDRFIFFGILHAIAAASLVGVVVLKLPWPVVAALGIGAVAAPQFLRSAIFDTPWLWWVGLSTSNPPSNDYVPLFPWLGPFLIGMAVAKLTVRYGWLGLLQGRERGGLQRLIVFGGRHSLAVYLLHQPILIAGLYLFSLVSPPPAPDPVETYLRDCNRSCSATNPAGYCERFCDCTLGALLDTQQFNELMSGRLDASSESISGIASQCSFDALEDGVPQ